jgi:hypothetical protein
MDTIYRAWHLELSSLFRSEHFMFFTDVPWVYYIYKDTYLPLSDIFYPDEYSILRDFFYKHAKKEVKEYEHFRNVSKTFGRF